MKLVVIGQLVAVAAAAVGSVGCSGGTPGGWGGHVVSWSHIEAGKEPVPGIDSAAVQFGTYGDGYAPVFWSDGGGGGFGAQWDKSRQAVHYDGTIATPDGHKIRVECFTADGKTGTVLIDGKKCPLESGPLFLIKTSGAEIEIRPLSIDSVTLQPETERLQALAAENAEIRSFFGGDPQPTP
jgi:hypothetical protein